MAVQVKLIKSADEKTISVTSSYNSSFVAKARKAAGEFVGGSWVFDAIQEKSIRKALIEIYGTDDSESAEKCVIKVAVASGVRSENLKVAGFNICRVMGRDSGVKMDRGVVILEGGLSSGGSIKNYGTKVEDGTILELHGFIISQISKIEEQKMGNDEPVFTLVKDDDDTSEKDSLLARKTELLKELAEIDSKLGVVAKVAKKAVKNGVGVMKNAWVIVRKMVAQGLGTIKSLFSSALKQAWVEAPLAIAV